MTKRNLALILMFSATLSFSAQAAAPALRKIKDVIIYEDSLFYAAFPSVVKLPDGELLLAFRNAPNRMLTGASRNIHCDQNSYLVTVRSSDGEYWSRDSQLLYAYPFGGSQDPCLLQLRDGTLLCTSYAWTLKPKAQRSAPGDYDDYEFLGGYYLRSEDHGNSWQGPYYPPQLPEEVKYSPYGNILPACNRGALYETQSGRILWGVIASDSTQKTSVRLITSDDKGLTWQLGGMIAADKNYTFSETSMYETPKGDIVAFIRTAGMNDMACIARSTDGGKTFTWQPMDFQGHPLNALRLPDNRVLLTYGYRHAPYGIRARILNAECTDFATAQEYILRDDGGNSDLGYTWPVLLSDNKVLITYYFNQKNGIRYIAGTLVEISKL